MPQVQMAGVEALEPRGAQDAPHRPVAHVGGAFIVPDRQPGLIPLALRPLVVRNLVTVGDTNVDIVEWVKENSFTNAAAETAEATSTATGGTKPESGIDYAVVQSTVKTIAHWIPATKRALSDVGQLRTLIDQRLQDGINLRLDSQMVNGDATGENLRGILNTSGVLTQARGADSGMDAVLKAITKIRLQFLEPTAILMHPTDARTCGSRRTRRATTTSARRCCRASSSCGACRSCSRRSSRRHGGRRQVGRGDPLGARGHQHLRDRQPPGLLHPQHGRRARRGALRVRRPAPVRVRDRHRPVKHDDRTTRKEEAHD
jgi:hypothetical protein